MSMTLERTFVVVTLLSNSSLIVLGFRKAMRSSLAIMSKNAVTAAILSLVAVVATFEVFLALAWRAAFFHALPCVPLLTRGILVLIFQRTAFMLLPESARQRDAYRTVVLGLMGIAFAGLVALSIVEAKLKVFDPLSFYYMFLSFIGLYITLNVQSYKHYAWQEQLGAGFLDLATLSFFLSLLSILQSGDQVATYKTALTAGALCVWLVDHIVRLYSEFQVAWAESLRFARKQNQWNF